MSPAGSGNCLYIALKWAFQDLFCEKYPYLFEDTDHQAMKMRVLLESQLESIGNVLSEDGVPLRMLLMECETEEELQCKIEKRMLPGTQGDFATIQSASNCFNAEIQLVLFSQDYKWRRKNHTLEREPLPRESRRIQGLVPEESHLYQAGIRELGIKS